MPWLSCLTCYDCAQVQTLKNDEEKQREVVAATLAATPQKLYSQDLDSFVSALEDYEARELKQLNALGERQRRALGKNKGKAKKVRQRRRH